jgi:hypothetical protein
MRLTRLFVLVSLVEFGTNYLSMSFDRFNAVIKMTVKMKVINTSNNKEVMPTTKTITPVENLYAVRSILWYLFRTDNTDRVTAAENTNIHAANNTTKHVLRK